MPHAAHRTTRPAAWASIVVLCAATALLPRVARAEQRCAASRACDAALLTPVRIGRADAPLKLTLWAQQEYSHLSARADVAEIFRDIFLQWARAHPEVQFEVSVMPALELHKAKLLLAAAAHRLPDVASVDSFWMPLFLEGGHVQPLGSVLARGGTGRLPALHDRHPDRRAGPRLRPVARHRLSRALLPDGPRPRAAAHLGRAAGDREPDLARARHRRAISTTRAAGRRRSSITCRCSGPREASSSTPPVSRSSASRPTASAWSA